MLGRVKHEKIFITSEPDVPVIAVRAPLCISELIIEP